MNFFDVNLRSPFANPELVMDLAKRANVIKLNDDELSKLASWARTGEGMLNTPRSPDALDEACAALAKATNTSRICVTRGADGAALWESGNPVRAPAPKGIIKNTVGAGDSFMEGLRVGQSRGIDAQKGCLSCERARCLAPRSEVLAAAGRSFRNSRARSRWQLQLISLPSLLNPRCQV